MIFHWAQKVQEYIKHIVNNHQKCDRNAISLANNFYIVSKIFKTEFYVKTKKKKKRALFENHIAQVSESNEQSRELICGKTNPKIL